MEMETSTAAAAAAAAGSTRRLLRLAAFLLLCSIAPVRAARKQSSYIVYLGGGGGRGGGGVSMEEASMVATESHYDLLSSVLGDREKARHAIFYSYTKNINGFAAVLDPNVAAEIAGHPGVVSVFPNSGRKMHTTRSWEFLGLERGGEIPRWSAWEVARYGEDTIIGNLDSGVWPESLSFNDGEMGPIPDGWKGICQNEHDTNFKCNSKLIGARYFNKGYAAAAGVPIDDKLNTPRDDVGHGTHTMSTAAGAAVRGATAFGFGNGTARGGSPRARVAAYRVCFSPPVEDTECFDADILAAFEAAINDGVHIITASVGGDPRDYLEDSVAIGSLHAVKAGITVVCSASNNGPDPGSVTNVAPWIITVAASTIDRSFPAYIIFNHTKAEGQSLSEAWLRKPFYPMISAADAVAHGSTVEDAQVCALGTLDAAKVTGKIVVCVRGQNRRMEKGETVRRAGGIGMVLINDEPAGNTVIADAHVLPALHINYADGLKLLAYLKSIPSPSGFITKARTLLGVRPAPVMAAFSSQGPNMLNPEILKPDVTAPGVSVIAAWSGGAAPSDRPWDMRRVPFGIQSGTSMACPHVSGIAGLIKTLHPDWSPAAIKSAIMTTATEMDTERRPIENNFMAEATPFSYGAGHVFPSRALDPGLVYDASIADYLNFLCALGYNATAMELFNKLTPYQCPAAPVGLQDLNLPSITVHGLAGPTAVRRRVKNVGPPHSTYTAAVVKDPEGVTVTVSPPTLSFVAKGEEKEFQVSFEPKAAGAGPAPLAGSYAFGAIVWSDGFANHQVRSPLVVSRRG